MATNKIRSSGAVDLPAPIEQEPATVIIEPAKNAGETKTQLSVKLFPDEIRLLLEAVGGHRGILTGELENANQNLIRAREGLVANAERHQIRAASLTRSIAKLDDLVRTLTLYAQ